MDNLTTENQTTESQSENQPKMIKRPFYKDWKVYLMFLPAAAVLFVFNYLPLVGLVTAFKKYYGNGFVGMFQSPWADPLFKNFNALFGEQYFWICLRNTVVISLLRLLICFPAPIFLALIYNELSVVKRFKRVSQTILYLPHFLSWVVLAGIFKQIFRDDSTGMINALIINFGGTATEFLTKSSFYLPFIILSDMWQNVGFASILYLAAIAGIDTEQYEAAKVDGANRWIVMAKITMPELIPTIVLQLILNISKILDGGFGQIYNTYNENVYDVADIIDTYVYRTGITEGKIEKATALGFFKSVVGLVLVLITNKISDKLTGEGIF